MGQTECSEMSAYKIQMPGNYPEENIQQLMPVTNCILLCAFLALCINFKNTYGISNINFPFNLLAPEFYI
jgi:hypothetical protein